MAFVHSKNTVVKVATKDLSAFTTSSEFTRKGDTHETTGYGAASHAFRRGLAGGTFKLEGTYDNTATTGPRAVLEPLIDQEAAAVIRQPEGTGTGKAQDSFNWIVEEYTETAPVADMVKWSCSGLISGDVNSTPQ